MFFSSASQSVLRIRSDFPISGQILLSCRTLCRVSSSEPLANLVAGRAGAGQTSPSASILHIRMWKVENPVWKPGSVSTGCGKVPWLPNTRQWTKKCWFSKRFPSFPHSTSPTITSPTVILFVSLERAYEEVPEKPLSNEEHDESRFLSPGEAMCRYSGILFKGEWGF